MAQKSSQRRKQKQRGFSPNEKPPEIPFLVKLAVSDRLGSRLTRNQAVSRAMIQAILSPIIFGAMFFLSERLFFGALFASLVSLALAIGQWQAIRWLDRHQAWRHVR